MRNQKTWGIYRPFRHSRGQRVSFLVYSMLHLYWPSFVGIVLTAYPPLLLATVWRVGKYTRNLDARSTPILELIPVLGSLCLLPLTWVAGSDRADPCAALYSDSRKGSFRLPTDDAWQHQPTCKNLREDIRTT